MSFLLQQFFGISLGEKYVSIGEQLHGCTIKTGCTMQRKVLNKQIYIYIYKISIVLNENSTIFFKNSKGKFVKIFIL